MAQAKTRKFSDQTMLLGGGETPTELFTAPCGFETLTMTVNVESNTTNVPDCAAPEAAAWLVTQIVSQQMVLTGDGVLDQDAQKKWRDWFMLNGVTKNVRYMTAGNLAAGGGYFQAPALLTNYEESGTRGELWQVSVEITLNGAPVWTPAAA